MPLFTSRKGRSVAAGPVDFWRRNELPYGVWACEDGREVLFNRFYEPIWQRASPSANPEPADPKESAAWKHQWWFYDDSTKRKAEVASAVLVSWGVPVPPKPGRKIICLQPRAPGVTSPPLREEDR
jgi:hypothetical protein